MKSKAKVSVMAGETTKAIYWVTDFKLMWIPDDAGKNALHLVMAGVDGRLHDRKIGRTETVYFDCEGGL